MARRSRNVGGWLRLWLLCMMLWLVLTSTVARTEVVTGVIASALAATVGYAVARRDDYGVRAPAAWLRWFVALPRRVVVDTARVARALVDDLRGRAPRDKFVEVALPAGAHDSSERDARAALTALFVSASPNQYLVDIDDERGIASLHALVPQGAGTVEEVLRGK